MMILIPSDLLVSVGVLDLLSVILGAMSRLKFLLRFPAPSEDIIYGIVMWATVCLCQHARRCMSVSVSVGTCVGVLCCVCA